MVRYLTLTELSEELGRPGQRRLMHFLIERAGVVPVQIGGRQGIHPRDVPRLRTALKRWDERSRVVPV